MSTRGQINQIKALKAALPAPAADGASIYAIQPQDWPVSALEDYDAAKASEDTERQFTIIEAQTGVRMRRTPLGQVIEIRVRADGPQ